MADLPEEWRDIPGWENRAQISNHGRVRTWKNGATPALPGYWFIRKLNRQGGNYTMCSLPQRAEDKTQPCIYVHRVVAEVFIGPRPADAVIRHGKQGRHVNTVTNLSYGTPTENVADDVTRGIRRGVRNGRAKLTEREVRAIKRLLASGLIGVSALARAFAISPAAIEFIRDGRNWRHVKI